MAITIREIQKSDYSQLEALYKEITVVDFPEYSQKDIQTFITNPRMEKWLTVPIRYGAFDGDRLVGYVLVDEPFGGVMYVSWLCTAKEYRGQGIGAQLLAKVDEVAKKMGIHSLNLRCDARNVPFYEAQGYIQYVFDKNSYFGTDDYLMKKELGTYPLHTD